MPTPKRKAAAPSTDRPKRPAKAKGPRKTAGAEGESASKSSSGEKGSSASPRMPIVAIGSSAGGLEALQEFFAAMPPDTGMAFVVVTHVRPGRESIMPELLSAVTSMEVIHAEDRTDLKPNRVVVARDSLLSVSKRVLRPVKSDNEPEATYHPVDHFFRSLAADQHEHAIGIILSGSGNDGSLGLKAIKAAGGMIMAQAPDNAKYSSMPEQAIATHLVDYVLPSRDLPKALVDYSKGPFLSLASRSDALALPESAIQAILLRLRAHSGQDFTSYKKSTMARRIQRRMNVHQIQEPQAYLALLRENPHEIDALMEELLISVTSFFRDPATWKALAEEAIAPLIRERVDGQPLRVWVAGCATGEEAYSAAIVLHEQVRLAERTHRIQIFATDLDERAIDIARAGLYPQSIAADVSPERLKTFFASEDGAYRIIKSVRDNIVFATQNIISDPPFTRVDLIICRNVLIYLDGDAQQHVLPNFHYALQPGGILFLGSAESVGDASDLFEVLNAKYKILRRKEVSKGPQPVLPGATYRRTLTEGGNVSERTPRAQVQFSRRVEQLLLERFVPCSILVDERGTVLHVQGRSGLYLEPEQGAPRNNVLEMAREGLGPTLAAALRQIRQEQQAIARSGVRVRTNGGFSLVDVTVTPVKEPESLRGLILITLQSTTPAPTGEAPASQLTGVADNLEIERELQRTRENLQTTIEELETSNEELKSSNEELQSTNEELQSTNEELETSKEEMQSLNEELNTVNSELQAKVEALARINDDMSNLLNSMQVATIFLDTELRVKRYTEQARDVVRLIGSDIGRPLSDLTSNLRYDSLIDDCRKVLSNLIPIEKEVQATGRHWYQVRLIPYRTADNTIEGLVMIIVDVDRAKQVEETLRKALANTQGQRDVLATLLERLPMGIVVASAPEMTIQSVSRFGLEVTGQSESALIGLTIEEFLERWTFFQADGVTRAQPESLPLTRAAERGEVVRNELWFLSRPDGTRIPIVCTAAPIRDAQQRIIGGVFVWQDVSGSRRVEEELRRTEQKYRAVLEAIDEGFGLVEVLFDDRNNPVDFRFLETNPAFERQTGLAQVLGKTMRDVAPRFEKAWLRAFGQVVQSGRSVRIDRQADEAEQRYEAYAWRFGLPQHRQVAVLLTDTADEKDAGKRDRRE